MHQRVKVQLFCILQHRVAQQNASYSPPHPLVECQGWIVEFNSPIWKTYIKEVRSNTLKIFLLHMNGALHSRVHAAGANNNCHYIFDHYQHLSYRFLFLWPLLVHIGDNLTPEQQQHVAVWWPKRHVEDHHWKPSSRLHRDDPAVSKTKEAGSGQEFNRVSVVVVLLGSRGLCTVTLPSGSNC